MASLKDVFNHLVLPPQVPGSQDESIESIGQDILQRLIEAARQLGRLADPREKTALKGLRRALHQTESLHGQGRLEKQTLSETLQELESGLPILLHVGEQNAVITISRQVMYVPFTQDFTQYMDAKSLK